MRQSRSQLHKYPARSNSSYAWQSKNVHKNRRAVSIQLAFFLSLFLRYFQSLFHPSFYAFSSFLLLFFCFYLLFLSNYLLFFCLLACISVLYDHFSNPSTVYDKSWASAFGHKHGFLILYPLSTALRVTMCFFRCRQKNHNCVALHVIKFYRETTLQLQWFLNSALNGGTASALRSDRFTLGKEPPITVEWESSWAPQIWPTWCWEQKYLLPFWGSKLVLSFIQPLP